LRAGYGLASVTGDDAATPAEAAGAAPPAREGAGLLALQWEAAVRRDLPPTIEGRVARVKCRRTSISAGLCEVDVERTGAGRYLIDFDIEPDGRWQWRLR